MFKNIISKFGIKILTIFMIFIFGGVGIFIANLERQIKGLEAVNNIYLSAACINKNDFQRVLENYDFKKLHLELPSEKPDVVKKAWVKHHISLCNWVYAGKSLCTPPKRYSVIFGP